MAPGERVRADWQPPGTAREQSVDVQRLETALDRISAALVRRAERRAQRADQTSVAPPFDDATVGELRRRLDEMIGRVRTLLDETAT